MLMHKDENEKPYKYYNAFFSISIDKVLQK